MFLLCKYGRTLELERTVVTAIQVVIPKEMEIRSKNCCKDEIDSESGAVGKVILCRQLSFERTESCKESKWLS